MTENKEKNNYCEKNWKLVNFCEFDKYATSSYCAIHNEDGSKNLGDITKVDETKLEPFNMICGGSPPCQDFSVAGKQKGSVWTCKDCRHEYNPLTVHWSERDKCPCCGSNNIEKTRSSLLVEYLRVIRANKPNFGMYENVKNIVGKQFKDTFKMFTDELDEYGYNVYWKVLNAKDYGIPQNRERVYLIFIKKELDNGRFTYPEPFDKRLACSNEKLYRYEWIIEKTKATGHLNAKKMPMKAHENVLIFYKKLPTYNPQMTEGHTPVHSYTKHTTDGNCYGATKTGISGGGSTQRYPRDVLQFKWDTQKSSLHQCQKPVEACEYFIKTYTNPGDLVLDSCSGSCTTAVAALNTGRNYICFEKDKDIFEVGSKRVREYINE